MVIDTPILNMMNLFMNEPEKNLNIFLFNLLYKHLNAHDFFKCFSLHKTLAMHEGLQKKNMRSICNGRAR
jgi:glycosyltransferase involved in cell wall biosynthesis